MDFPRDTELAHSSQASKSPFAGHPLGMRRLSSLLLQEMGLPWSFS